MSELTEIKLLLGKILGESYRTQKRIGDIECPVSNGRIYGLLNGFEEAIDEELESIGQVTNEHVKLVADAMDYFWNDSERQAAFKGFYDLERKLGGNDIDRGTINRVLRYFYADGKFASLIDKMNNSNSPIESRTFELGEYDI